MGLSGCLTLGQLHRVGRRSLCGVAVGLLASLGVLLSASAKPASAAERIRLTLAPLEISISVAELDTFAKTGEATGGLRFYLQRLDERRQAEFRSFLQRRLDVSPEVISQISYSLMGERTLRELGQIIRTHNNLDGFHALRGSLLLAASDPEGMTVVNVLRRFPGYSVRLNAGQLLALWREFGNVLDYRDSSVEAIRQAMVAESAAEPVIDPTGMANLATPGAFRVERRGLALRRDRQSLNGTAIERPFGVDVFLPVGVTQPAPVVVISHGLGSTRSAFAYLGEHLATHGFVAVIPDHIGSGEEVRTALLDGVLGSDINPVEYIDRPLDIQFTLDYLEQLAETDPEWTGRMNLQQVGVIGHSFGGYTALALAGAPLNSTRLQQTCSQPLFSLNAAPILQCIANRLPPYAYPLRDERIRAAYAISPITSVALGPEGLSQIQVPTMISAGSNDFIASIVQEQIHPFLWLTTEPKYLAVMVPSGHVVADATPTSNDPTSQQLLLLLAGPEPELGRDYVQELSLAFMQAHLANRPEFADYLTASYVQATSRDGLDLLLVRSLTPEQLELAYGATPPIPIVPELPAVASTTRNPVLGAIAQTGQLRAAIRQDAAPFGYIGSNGQLTGFCLDLLTELAATLEQQLGRSVDLELVALSTFDTRIDVVRRGVAQIECGPNSIPAEASRVAYSTPFFLTGTHFLVPSANGDDINPLSGLQNLRVGVQRDTSTERFVRQRYPEALVIALDGSGGSSEVQALQQGLVDTVAGDGILLLAEAQQQGLGATVQLSPATPLSCEPYGLIMPEGDAEWTSTVNQFIGSPAFQPVWETWFGTELYDYIFLGLDFCALQPQPTGANELSGGEFGTP